MQVLIAPDSFKGSLSSKEVAKAIEEGIKRVANITTLKIPIADGGEGTVEALIESIGGDIIHVENIVDPLGKKIKSFYGILKNGTAVIEIAASSGLYLVPVEKRNPLKTTTYGVGQLIKSALNKGCRKFIIGIGGSATNDAGVGMIQALGAKITDSEEKQIDYGGGQLHKIKNIDLTNLDKRIKESEFIAATDVLNPLYGENGASIIYGPQKGATKEISKILDNNLKYFSKLVAKTIGKDYSNIPGSGAAGGLGFALIAFLKAKLQPGVEIIIEATKLEEKIKNSDIIITGEGNTDYQTIFGKAPSGIAKLAQKHNKPVIILSGGLGKDYKKLYNIGITSLFSIVNRPMELNEAMKNAYNLIADSTEDIIRIIMKFSNI
ncbi:MAG: glycerate kinase [Thermoanaerobacteraceae bacterium]